MSKKTIRLKEKKPEPPRRHLKLKISGTLGADIEDYGRLYAEVHGQEIELGRLVEGILEQFLESDHEFQKRKRRERAGAPGSELAKVSEQRRLT